MSTPRIKYYAKLEFVPNGKETPKYTITEEAGFMPEMEQLKGRDGKVSMYFCNKIKDDKSSTPPKFLQAKNSLNFTGLKDYWLDGQMSGYAYGFPDQRETYSSKNKPNPLYPCRNDGFLFVVHYEQAQEEPQELIKPSAFELIVIEGGRLMIGAYCKQLMMGGFDEALEQLRKQAVAI